MNAFILKSSDCETLVTLEIARQVIVWCAWKQAVALLHAYILPNQQCPLHVVKQCSQYGRVPGAPV